MNSLTPISKRIKTLENQKLRLQQQIKALSVEYRTKLEETLLKKKQALINQLKRANSNVRRARSATAKKRAATAAATRRLNAAINQQLVNLTKQGYQVKGVQMRGR
jgi:Spy/CpxP family protein refolding chaperone